MKQPSQILEEQLGLVEDGDAMFKSILWYEDQRSAGKLKEYERMHIAIYGEDVIDSDRDKDELSRRLDARGDTINRLRVIVKYVPSPEDTILYG